MLQAIDRIIDRIINGFAWLGGLMLCSIIFMASYESVVRYLGYPTSWTLELTEYALVYSVFLGVSYAEKYGDHIRVDFFIDLLTRKTKQFVEIFNYICIILFIIPMIYYGFRLCLKSFTAGVLSPTPLGVPLFWIHLIFPIGMALMFVKILLKFISLLRVR
jgi:TRAP-type C4-dicarboxylate transport system permease small subunit